MSNSKSTPTNDPKEAKAAAQLQTDNNSKPVETPKNDLAAQESALNDREVALNNLESALKEREDRLKDRESKLDIFHDNLKSWDEELNTRLSNVTRQESALKDKETVKPVVQEEDVVLAVNADGVERSFPRVAWNNLGKDKNGFKIKVETPKEARGE